MNDETPPLAAGPIGNRKSGFVAIVGRPNVGKSTLLNQIMGTKVSIISDKPQTTRNRILGVRTEDRGQAVFFDTPGIHKPGYELNRRMVQEVYDALHTADVIFHMVDISQSFGHGEQFVLDVVRKAGRPSVLVINKIDLSKKSKVLSVIDFYRQQFEYDAYVPICAQSGDGVEPLLEEMFRLLPVGERFYDEDFITDSPERFLVAELVREKVLQLTRQELPYTTAVVIDRFDESEREEKQFIRIEASVVVERQSQKGIVIGRNGAMLKEIGSQARREIESLLDSHVYLGLFVKVQEDWRNNPRFLNQIGLIR